jgi:hypothetical protein
VVWSKTIFDSLQTNEDVRTGYTPTIKVNRVQA